MLFMPELIPLLMPVFIRLLIPPRLPMPMPMPPLDMLPLVMGLPRPPLLRLIGLAIPPIVGEIWLLSGLRPFIPFIDPFNGPFIDPFIDPFICPLSE